MEENIFKYKNKNYIVEESTLPNTPLFGYKLQTFSDPNYSLEEREIISDKIDSLKEVCGNLIYSFSLDTKKTKQLISKINLLSTELLLNLEDEDTER